jgi:endonuclease/exonuclease/phosphatase family metal-dependent hydrolase
MRPFDPGVGDSGPQIDFDERRVRYLESVAVRALVKSPRLQVWVDEQKRLDPVQRPGADKPDPVSRYEAGYDTICVAVADVGIEALDPGLDAVREELRAMTPDERTAQLRAWLLDEKDRVRALGRAVLARARPERTDELFGWSKAGIDLATYWAPNIASVHMEYLLETADFGANELIRILYLLPEVPEHLQTAALRWRDPDALGREPNFPADGLPRLRTLFTDFKYWMDDPFRCSEFTGFAKEVRAKKTDAAKAINTHEEMEEGRDMTYWSENHRLLFATAEYLAGQFWPDEQFVSMRAHRKEGPAGPPRPGDLTGAEHRDSARRRVLRWLDERLRTGFAEWNAPGYYVYDVMPLLNLVDFAADEQVRVRAAMVLDLLVFDLAVNLQGGAFAGAAGRAYFEHKNCVWGQSVRDCCELLFGTFGHFADASNAAIFLATSPGYRPPDALLLLGARPPRRFTSRSRVSISFDEAADHGVGFRTLDDMEFWWSRAGYATKETIRGSIQVATNHGLLQTPPFREILPLITAVAEGIDTAEDVGAGILGGIAAGALGLAVGGPVGMVAGAALGAYGGASILDFNVEDAADMASVITEGSVLSRANTYAHRDGGASLASVQDFRPGQLNFQGLPCIAALANGAMVWTSYPSAGSALQLTLDSSTWAFLGAIAGGPIGFVVGAFAMPDIEIDEDIFPVSHDGPTWWTGNVVQPRVVQQDGAAITAYQAKEIQTLLFGERTHAWFPRSQFKRTSGPHAARCNHDSGRWFFGAVAHSYVALFSARETNWTHGGPWDDREIRAEGPTNIFITQIGSADTFGSFEAFVAAVTTARVHVSGLHGGGELQCSYDVPNGQRLELHYDGVSRYGGLPVWEDHFPRMHNPFTRISWGQDRYAIQYGGRSVVHDVVAGSRTTGRELHELVHDTPLTFYAQNMALLPGPLYKGVDRDRALAHLVDVLRARRPDVVGLSEIWVSGERDDVREALADVYPFTIEGAHDPLVETPLGDVEIMGGGLLLLSRHPIVASASTVYRQCSGDDCLTNKGVLHARIAPRGHPCGVDVFLTHTQAPHPTVGGTTAGARAAVEAQIRHLASFVRGCRDVAGPAVLFGDFNVDWFAHRDLYDYLVATLGLPVDTKPAVDLEGRPRATGTSESDDDDVSSFHDDHPARPADDPRRFAATTERLDYIFSVPGLLFEQHVAGARVVVEQWTPGRDMSDHYGAEATFDTTRQRLPADRAVVRLTVALRGFRCLQTTSGPGDDEVSFSLEVRSGRSQGPTSTAEYEDVEPGTAVTVESAAVEVDGGDEVTLIVRGRESDWLSADDALGTAVVTLAKDELLAVADAGPTLVGMPILTGDGGEYAVDVVVTVEAPTSARPRTAARV